VLRTYGGKLRLRTPGVGSVLPWVVVVGTGRMVVVERTAA
jgi:hypothetical protein